MNSIALKTVPIPKPLNLSTYVVNEAAAIRLGKALFWDMQMGSDGVQACGTCHFHAGADNRTRNQLNPGLAGGDTVFGNNLLGLPAPSGGQFAPNVNMGLTKFPFHKLTDKNTFGEPLGNPANVISDTNDVCGSQGVELRQFFDIVPGSPVELSTPLDDPVFNRSTAAGPVNIRRVEDRNTPTVINSVFNFANFWDGRANNIFNGNNPFGPADPRSHVIVNRPGTMETQRLLLRQAGLASQAVGPPLSDSEMSWRGRTWPKIGKKMISLKPLAQQQVSPQDSVLGPLADTVAGAGLNTTYAQMIRQAFPARYWDNIAQIVTFVDGAPVFSPDPGTPLTTDQYTQMEANFAFFFGLAVQLYESTLVADSSAFDLFLEGAGNQTLQESRGMGHFLGSCAVCHAGAELTDASVALLQGANPITGVPQPLNKNPLAAIEFMPFLSGFAFYDAPFHNNGVRPGGATDPTSPEFLATNEDTGRGGNTGLAAPLDNYPLSWGSLSMRKRGFVGPALPASLSPYVPDLPFGFRPIDTTPTPGRVLDFGGFKTPHLRNIALTGPYMHNGGMATLRQVVDFYTRGGDFPITNDSILDPGIAPIGILSGSATRKNELVAFLLTMTDARVANESAPFDHPEIFIPINGIAGVSTGSRAGFVGNTRFRQIPAVGSGGRSAAGLLPIAPFLGANPFRP
ncbi:MAG: cytochrome c peroxidase [Syntrophobacteraceae bacterium]